MYHKSLYVFDQHRPIPALVRNYEPADIPALIQIQQESFPPPFPPELWWNEEQLHHHIRLFPEGALCIEIDGQLAGSMTALRVDDSAREEDHPWESITDAGYIRSHRPQGGTLYVVDISVRPRYRKLGIGKCLMQAMYDVVVHLGLTRLLGGGRMPGYHLYAGERTAEQYLNAVVEGELKDPVITFLMRCGRTPVRVIPHYLEDEESCHYGALMEWNNPFVSSAR
ncbi:MAG: GNAT family N-acetyltransferase [Paenibacillus sp.]|uniref:GNAT family N-acetyltransferase n=1 Tax=Paenibacillus aquistagni TaxID=1852522 RepID=UPI000B50E1B9|nr:GNAT family N-acetyltransferase [Paenibacillus aquistagni]MBR2568427.1 GNAT family N-acetyltransferase [Paenibacillus sp.]